MITPRRRRFLITFALSRPRRPLVVPQTGYAQAPSQPAAEGGWNFEEDEEEAAPTWGDDIRAQALDITPVAAFSVLAFVSFFRKSVRLKYVTLVAAVLYLGFYKSQLISIVNVFGLMGGNLPIFRYNLAWYLLAAITVVSTVLWGRVYCGRICAFGAFTQLLDAVAALAMASQHPASASNGAQHGSSTASSRASSPTSCSRSDPLIYPYVEPFWMFGLHLRTPVLLTLLGTLLVTTVFVRNAYCRFLCPLGAFLGIVSNLTVFRIKRWSECSTCRICEKTCEWGAIKGPEDPADRVRPVRRLRTALRGHEEVPAPSDHHPQGRHPRAPGGARGLNVWRGSRSSAEAQGR